MPLVESASDWICREEYVGPTHVEIFHDRSSLSVTQNC
jgi:hypothetical protein